MNRHKNMQGLAVYTRVRVDGHIYVDEVCALVHRREQGRVHTHTHTCADLYVYIHATDMHVREHTLNQGRRAPRRRTGELGCPHTNTHTFTQKHMHMNPHMNKQTCNHKHACTHTLTHAHVPTHKHAHTHTHINTHM